MTWAGPTAVQVLPARPDRDGHVTGDARIMDHPGHRGPVTAMEHIGLQDKPSD